MNRIKRKAMVVAVAGALVAPAAVVAQESNVQIYGRVNLGLDNYASTGATAGSAADMKSRYRVFDYLSRLGFRGKESLGGGMSAIWQIESGVNVDTGSQATQSGGISGSTGFLASRVSFVGLQSNWGTLAFGRQNVWWLNGNIEVNDAFFGNAVGGFSGTFGRGMANGVPTRVSSTMQYTSPTFSGFNAVLSYSPGNQEAQPAGANADGRLWGITIDGTVGSIMVGYDFMNNKGNSPAVGSTPDVTANKARIGWNYRPGSHVSLLWVRAKQENNASVAAIDATATSLSQTFWGIDWEHQFGNILGFAQYGKTANISGCAAAGACSNTNATQYMLGARYLFSKRTSAYLTYGMTRNGAAYNLDYLAGGYTSGTAGVGADPRTYALGLMHSF